VKYFLYDRLALRADVRHILANAGAFEYTLGVTIPFGGAKGVTKPVSAPAAPKPGAGKQQERVAQEVPLKKQAEEQTAQKKTLPPAIPAIPEETPAPSQPAAKAMPLPAVVTTAEVVDNATNMQLVSIPNACYTMGDPVDKTLPAHEVCLSPFSIAKFEITREQFQRFVESTNYITDAEKHGGCYTIIAGKEVLNPAATWKNPDFYQSKKDPAVCVSWNDAQAFTTWLSQSSGKKYRLPTEAEWEFAARSGGKQEKYAGTNNDADLYRYANFCDMKCIYDWKDQSQSDGYWSTAPVGKYIPNGFGLYDMTGNVAQWTQDYFADDYYANSPKMDPKGPTTGTGRAVRGGSWRSLKSALTTTNRASAGTDNAFDNIGFRVCREP
jgi:formylglycine-generating enzyme